MKRECAAGEPGEGRGLGWLWVMGEKVETFLVAHE